MNVSYVVAALARRAGGCLGSALVACAVASGSVAGCVMVDDDGLDGELIGETEQAATVGNGILLNGILLNGILLNGLNPNGAATDGGIWGNGAFSEGIFAAEYDFFGMKTPGLHNAAFNADTLLNSWYWRFLLLDTTMVSIQTGADDHVTMARGDLAAEVLRYTYECAMPEGDVVDVDIQPFFTGGPPKHIKLEGHMNLAGEWADGSCNQSCQRWVSACLAARTNAMGKTVQISLTGFHPDLPERPQWEAQEFSYQEASFAGNLFNGEGVYGCSGAGAPAVPGIPKRTASDLDSRVCGHGNPDCAGFDFTGYCGGQSLFTGQNPQCALYSDYWLSCENPQVPGTYEYNQITVYLRTDDAAFPLPLPRPPPGGHFPRGGGGWRIP